MAWNEPGGNRNDKDPWGGGRRGGGDQGPPDLDEALKRGLEKLNRILSGGGGSSGKGGSAGSGSNFIFALLAAILVIAGIWSSFYTVDERERAVVLRFGKYLTTESPGLRFKLPLIDRVYKTAVTNINTITSRGEMLTQDENIVEVNLSVQYKIDDARSYVLNVRNPEESLAYATDSSLRHEVGSSELHQVLTEGRTELGVRIGQRLQQFLDNYTTGLRVVKVNVESTQPPREVQAAFQDVQRAREDEQRVKEEAERYRNKVVPEARGRAQRMLEEATAYKQEVMDRAKGDTSRYLSILGVYRQAPEVTRDRMYLDTMERVMSQTSKVMVDVAEGNNVMFLPLDKLAALAASAPRDLVLPDVSGGNSDAGSAGSARNDVLTPGSTRGRSR